MKKYSVFVFAALLAACQSQSGEGGSFGVYTADCVAIDDELAIEEAPLSRKAAPMMQNAATMGASMDNNVVEQGVTPRKIIKNGSLTISVDNIEQSKSDIYKLISKHGGYCSREQFYKYDWSNESGYKISIRIPCDNFDAFISDIENIGGETEDKLVYINDVTTQYIDLETRLNTKRNYLARYTELLKNAKSVTDIVAIEDKIRLIEEEIESVTGRLKYLNNQVEFSTLEVDIEHKDAYFDREHPDRNKSVGERLLSSVVKGFRGFIDFLFFLVRIWPAWIAILLIFWFIRKKRKSQE